MIFSRLSLPSARREETKKTGRDRDSRRSASQSRTHQVLPSKRSPMTAARPGAGPTAWLTHDSILSSTFRRTERLCLYGTRNKVDELLRIWSASLRFCRLTNNGQSGSLSSLRSRSRDALRPGRARIAVRSFRTFSELTSFPRPLLRKLWMSLRW